jgi:hypothetical protein
VGGMTKHSLVILTRLHTRKAPTDESTLGRRKRKSSQLTR